MPTADQVAKWSDAFEEVYPETLSDRLRWFHQELGVEIEGLLRLVGLSAEEAIVLEAGGKIDWKWLTMEYSDGAAWAEEMLLQAVAFFDYNWQGFRDHIRQTLRADHPFGRAGGSQGPLSTLTKEEQDAWLLGVIAEGNEKSAPALIVYLSPGPAS